MYSKLHRPEKNELGVSVNAGSCVKLAHYLDKESGSGKFFFSQNQDSVPLIEVIQKIATIRKHLKTIKINSTCYPTILHKGKLPI